MLNDLLPITKYVWLIFDQILFKFGFLDPRKRSSHYSLQGHCDLDTNSRQIGGKNSLVLSVAGENHISMHKSAHGAHLVVQRCGYILVDYTHIVQGYFTGSVAFITLPLPWWHHQMETFFALLALCEGNSPATGEFPSQTPVTRSLDFSLIYDWTNGWMNIRDASDLRHHLAHYDVTVIWQWSDTKDSGSMYHLISPTSNNSTDTKESTSNVARISHQRYIAHRYRLCNAQLQSPRCHRRCVLFSLSNLTKVWPSANEFQCRVK